MIIWSTRIDTENFSNTVLEEWTRTKAWEGYVATTYKGTTKKGSKNQNIKQIEKSPVFRPPFRRAFYFLAVLTVIGPGINKEKYRHCPQYPADQRGASNHERRVSVEAVDQ